jgi:uncharacterized repeat protein (TIGR01451 family)
MFNFNAGDSVTVNVFWGDGTDTIFTGELDPDQWAMFQIPHTYITAGEFYTYGFATTSTGLFDSVINTNPVVINSSCINVSGKIFLDENQNCVFDGNEIMIHEVYFNFVSANDTVAHYYDDDGAYSFDIGANQNYTLHLGNIPIGLEPLCPNTFNYNFDAGIVDMQIDFALICNATEPDNQIEYAFYSNGLPGNTTKLYILLSNANCVAGSGTLTIELDSLLEYVSLNSESTDDIPVSVNGNSITFNFSNLTNSPSLIKYIASLKLLVKPNALQGDSFCIDINIIPTDLDSTNNTKHICGIINGPYDPNQKRVSPLGTGEDAIVAPGTELIYTVEFQNTGNAPAFNVILLDTLDSDFDLSTFQVLGYSHPMTYTILGNEVNFSFQNIMLPDSGSNEPASHGWVSYKIKPNSTAPLGTVVTNRASIYFDNNVPVLTNKTKNTFDNNTGITSISASQKIFAFPNPAKDEIQFTLPENFSGDIEVRNIIGNLILT